MLINILGHCSHYKILFISGFVEVWLIYFLIAPSLGKKWARVLWDQGVNSRHQYRTGRRWLPLRHFYSPNTFDSIKLIRNAIYVPKFLVGSNLMNAAHVIPTKLVFLWSKIIINKVETRCHRAFTLSQCQQGTQRF